MAIRRRYLLNIPPYAPTDHLEEAARRLLARYPQAAAYDEDEVSDFFAVAGCLDDIDPGSLRGALRRARLHVPPRARSSVYRIGRHLLHRWHEPGMRQALVGTLVEVAFAALARLREAPVDRLLEVTDANGPLLGLWVMRQAGLGHRIAEVKAAFSEEQARLHQALLDMSRGLLGRYVTEPELLERQPGRREQRELIRQIRKGDLRMASMRRSIYALTKERKALLARTRRAEREAHAELEALSARLEAIRQEAAAAEVSHAAAMAEQSRRHAAEISSLQSELGAALEQFEAALREQGAGAPENVLNGRVIAVVGDEGRKAGYQALVESAGARMHYLNAVEKLRRIPDGVAGADIVILVTAHAKHQAEHLLGKAVRPGALVLRCPTAGLAAFERTLRTAVLPRVALRELAAARQGR